MQLCRITTHDLSLQYHLIFYIDKVFKKYRMNRLVSVCKRHVETQNGG